MRGMLRRKTLTISAAIISVGVMAATGVVATATPALAGVNFCNVFGHNYCIGDSGTVTNGDAVVLTASGRDLNMVDQHFKNGNDEVYRLQFVANTSQCLGIPGNGSENITVRDCSGGNSSNVNWGMEFDTNGFEWRSTTVTGAGNALYLASDNFLGDQLFVSELDNCPGCLFKWTN